MHTVITHLRPDELTSLRRLARARRNGFIRRIHVAKLIRAGFAKFQAGILTITTMGSAKLILETTRASWFLTPRAT